MVRFWAAVIADPDQYRRRALDALGSPGQERRPISGGMLDRPAGRRAGLLGVVALALDETAQAIGWFEQAAHTTRERLSRFDSTCLGALQWAYVDAGRVEDAQRQIESIFSSPAGLAGEFARNSALLVHAMLTDLTTDDSAPNQLLNLADAATRTAVYHPYLQARWRHARALVAAGRGDHAEAWRQLRFLFAADSEPVHYLLSNEALGDLASAASRIGRTDEAAEIISEQTSWSRAQRSLRARLICIERRR